jgi:hypothetical protein
MNGAIINLQKTIKYTTVIKQKTYPGKANAFRFAIFGSVKFILGNVKLQDVLLIVNFFLVRLLAMNESKKIVYATINNLAR